MCYPKTPRFEPGHIERLRPRIAGQPLEQAQVASPLLLRTVEPPLRDFVGRRVEALARRSLSRLLKDDWPRTLEELE